MKAVEFCYWLQGAFELADLLSWTQTHVQCVAKHVALVKATDQAQQPQACVDFVDWLTVALDFIPTSSGNSAQVRTIRERLNKLFEHAIDPLYASAAALNAAHGNAAGKPCC